MSHLLHPTQVCAVYRISAQTFRKLRQRYPLSSARLTSSGPLYHPAAVAAWWAELPGTVRRIHGQPKRIAAQRTLKRLMNLAATLRKESDGHMRLLWNKRHIWTEYDGVLGTYWPRRRAEAPFWVSDALISRARALNPANQAKDADRTAPAA